MTEYYETRYSFDSGRSKVWKAITEYLQQYVHSQSDRVLDLGAGYCDFINNIQAKEKLAFDMNPRGREHCAENVEFYCGVVTDMKGVASASINVLFASNLLEHLDDAELALTLKEFNRVLVPGARVILMQPNFRYAYKEYFDDYTHKKVFSHISLSDLLSAHGFEPIKIEPKFLPFSLKSRLPKSYFLTKMYLWSFYRPMAKQMLLVFKKSH